MRVLSVIESKVWVHAPTGRTASIYGACPWVSAADRPNWSLVSRGWTWSMDDGTVGMCRVPAKTREEALAVMERVNAFHDECRRAHAAMYPPQPPLQAKPRRRRKRAA